MQAGVTSRLYRINHPGTSSPGAEVGNDKGTGALCTLGAMATHQSSGIKIKVIGDYPKSKINGRALRLMMKPMRRL